MTLILASVSPRRQELLKNLGLDFEVIPSHFEENLQDFNNPINAVLSLASAKAHEVGKQLATRSAKEEVIILAGDTIVVLDDRLIGQPKTKSEAESMLSLLSGRCHQVYTGVVLLSVHEQREISGHEISKVYMRNLNTAEIQAYIATGEPMDKAGAYALQGVGSALVEKIEGCFSNVIGFPIPLVVRLLRQSGFTILGLP